MGYAWTDEQQDLREIVRRFLEEQSPMSEVRRLMQTEAGHDPAVWSRMAGELGLQAVAIPEDCGGAGLGAVELGLVLSELGRSLACVPYLSSVVLAGGAIAHVATGAQRSGLLGGIAAGETAALALREPGGGPDPADVALVARPDGSGFRLDGTKTLVVDGHVAARIVCVARLEGSTGRDGLGLFLLDGDAPGLERRRLQTLDPTRRLARLELAGVRAEPLGTPGRSADALERALDEARVALACEMVGGMERVVETAVDYARSRVQFGRPIGSFQAIKHRCADMHIALEAARTLARFAAAAIAEGDPELPLLAAAAQSRAADAYRRLTTDNVQIHGGVGFTFEYDAHLFYRRAHGSDLLLGDARHHRERLARRLAVAARAA